MDRCLAPLLLGLLLGPGGCADRDLGEDEPMEAEMVEHPAELLEQHALACEGWLELQQECEREHYNDECATRSFDDEHVLCVEKAVLVLECKASLRCDEIALLYDSSTPAQDTRCFGERLAETIACHRDY